MQLEKLYWRDVRADIYKLNQELAEIIDKLNPPDDCFFYKAEYPYGDMILENGVFRLPMYEGKKHRLTDPEVPDEIKKELGYNPGTYPTLLVLEHCAELFIDINNTSVPFTLLLPGDIIGLSGVLRKRISNIPSSSAQGKSAWSMSSGTRSTFFLPKICDAVGHKRLEKKLNILIRKPVELFDHWQVFRAIYSSIGRDWNTKVLFFSKCWLENIHNQDWLPLKLYLHQIFIQKIKNYWINLSDINVSLAEIHFQENLKPSLNVIDILRNIFSVAASDSLGFQPATDDSILPTSLIQDAYIDIYKLRDYYPTIMQPAYYKRLNINSIYTSVNMMAIENLYDVLKVHSDAQLMEEVAYTFQKYAEVLKKEEINIDSLYLGEIIKNRKIEFFHYLRYKEMGLMNSKEVALLDKNFISSKYPNNQELAYAGSFIKACVKISPK